LVDVCPVESLVDLGDVLYVAVEVAQVVVAAQFLHDY